MLLNRRATVSLLLTLVAVFALACGSGSDSGANSDSPGASDVEEPTVIRSSDSFTVDSFTVAGFKKSKEFSTETVPEAAAIWYGFYDQRDVEIRFYDTHELAIGPGVASAEQAVGRSPNSNIGGGIITSAGNRTQYNDFLVAGNAVILCQTNVAPCIELAELLP